MYILSSLTHLTNLFFKEGIFLKTSVIKPIFKKGSESNIENYRSIALLSIIAKKKKNPLQKDYTPSWKNLRFSITGNTALENFYASSTQNAIVSFINNVYKKNRANENLSPYSQIYRKGSIALTIHTIKQIRGPRYLRQC